MAADAPAVSSAKMATTARLNIPSLGTISITGSQLHALWQIRKGLSAIHSFHNPDALVCSLRNEPGSRINKILFCESNQHWWERTDHGGGISGDALHETVYASVNYPLFRKVMRNLPPEPTGVAADDPPMQP